MKTLKIISISVFIFFSNISLDKNEKKILNEFSIENKKNLNELLLQNQLGCRPQTKVKFYIETEIIKKQRGFNIVETKIFVLDKFSGKNNLLTRNNILMLNYEDTVIDFNIETENSILINGDRILTSDKNTPFSLTELMKFEEIAISYNASKNKLLKRINNKI
ncbi:hypothetical protein [Polaribacter porphyrae]|uniref:Uncharacterized protein n=1 Tax=Polaribacter porphyrae TaxID=1137780 RepID=A0A2S7WMS1_9FLAO|nr:hypothetical protein [Polaribacter porphyrae]PQJ78917.1 hypothetical protein BTO18_06855 [Polaribacter porphyrae]